MSLRLIRILYRHHWNIRRFTALLLNRDRQELAIDDALISNIVTENKELTEEARRDMRFL